jgi:peptidoglycan-associated lipoprotein
MTRRPAVLVLMMTALALGACSKKKPPETVTPPTPTANQDSLRAAREAEAARMRADSISRAEAAARAAAAEAERAARATLTETVFFDYDQFDIKAETADLLRRKVDVLQANPAVQLKIVGHADERGSVEYNLALGLRRANAVKDFLTGFNLDAARFAVETMGEQQPLDPNQNETAYARNRRAEFQVTSGGDNLRTGR